jgi:hypothetical protein
MRRLLSAAALLVLTATAPPAFAADGEGIPVTVTVMNSAGDPVPTAVIRHPDEADRHRVNSVDGSWTESVLYMPDGTELKFEKGLLLQLEISAPGYMMQTVEHEIKKRKNAVEITLLPQPEDDEPIEEPMMSFSRDESREATE